MRAGADTRNVYIFDDDLRPVDRTAVRPTSPSYGTVADHRIVSPESTPSLKTVTRSTANLVL